MTSVPAGPDRVSLRKAIGWTVAFLLLGIGLSGGIMSVWVLLKYGSVGGGLQALKTPGPHQLLIAGVSQLMGFALATWVIGFRVLGLSRTQLRWASPRKGVRGLAIGLALGATAATAALVTAVLVANSHWTRDAGGLGEYLVQIGKTSLVLAPAALSEEIMFRGVPLVLFASAVNRGTALVLVAGVVFALFHALNPDVTPLGLGNIALAGVFLGVAFYAPGGLWTAFGAHLGWNATLAALDAPVSGLPFSIPWIDYQAGNPVWLSGGRFGPEGGLLATAAITAALLATVRWAGKDPA